MQNNPIFSETKVKLIGQLFQFALKNKHRTSLEKKKFKKTL